MGLAHTVLVEGFKASGAISYGRFCTLTASDTVKQADAAGQRAGGVSENAVAAAEATLGRQVAVVTLGVAWVEASAAIALGALVSSAADGRAKTGVATEVPLGIARAAAGAAGDLIPVLLVHGLPVL